MFTNVFPVTGSLLTMFSIDHTSLIYSNINSLTDVFYRWSEHLFVPFILPLVLNFLGYGLCSTQFELGIPKQPTVNLRLIFWVQSQFLLLTYLMTQFLFGWFSASELHFLYSQIYLWLIVLESGCIFQKFGTGITNEDITFQFFICSHCYRYMALLHLLSRTTWSVKNDTCLSTLFLTRLLFFIFSHYKLLAVNAFITIVAYFNYSDLLILRWLNELFEISDKNFNTFSWRIHNRMYHFNLISFEVIKRCKFKKVFYWLWIRLSLSHFRRNDPDRRKLYLFIFLFLIH